MDSVRFSIFGRVQGVNMRRMVQDKACDLGISGYVYNDESSSSVVHGFLQGDRVDELLDFIRSSPGFSEVESVEVFDVGFDENVVDFRILR